MKSYLLGYVVGPQTDGINNINQDHDLTRTVRKIAANCKIGYESSRIQFNKRYDVLLPDFMKFQSCKIRVYNLPIALKYGMRHNSSATVNTFVY